MSAHTSTHTETEHEAPDFPGWFKYLLLSLVWILIGTLFALQLWLYEKIPGRTAFQLALLDWGPWILVSPLILWLSKKVQISHSTWKWALPLHLLSSILLALLLEVLVSLAFRSGWIEMRGGPRRGGPPPPEMVQPDPKRPRMEPQEPMGPGPRGNMPPPPQRQEPGFRMVHARFNIPIYWVLVTAIHALAYHRRSLQRERRALKAEALLAEARLSALQAQINPHFLFNTLNAIALYVHENPKAAEEMIESLSEMLRVVLASSHRREVSLLEELAFIDRYLAIQKHRFGDRLEVQREIAQEALAVPVPTLLLQPLVENAIVHGIAPARRPGTIFIRANLEGERLHLQVSDTGNEKQEYLPPGQEIQVREGVGVGNTRDRLRTVYGEDFSFTLSKALEGGICSSIDIPRIRTR